MMQFDHLPQKWIDYLATQPETGMGYQKVSITDKNGVFNDIFVDNCELFDKSLGIDINNIIDIQVI